MAKMENIHDALQKLRFEPLWVRMMYTNERKNKKAETATAISTCLFLVCSIREALFNIDSLSRTIPTHHPAGVTGAMTNQELRPDCGSMWSNTAKGASDSVCEIPRTSMMLSSGSKSEMFRI